MIAQVRIHTHLLMCLLEKQRVNDIHSKYTLEQRKTLLRQNPEKNLSIHLATAFTINNN